MHVGLNPNCDRVRAAEHEPRGPSSVLVRLHGLVEIVENGAVVIACRPRTPRPTLEELRESVEILEDTERTTRRMLGNTHPMTKGIELALQKSRDALRAREKPSPGSV